MGYAKFIILIYARNLLTQEKHYQQKPQMKYLTTDLKKRERK